MASESVATADAAIAAGSKHDIWIGADGNHVLTITIDKNSKAFPPDSDQSRRLNDMIQGLSRATKAVAYHATHDAVDVDFAMQPIEDLADAIMVLSHLSAAICTEANA